MPTTECPLIDDANLPSIYFDGVAYEIAVGANVRVLAFEYRRNPLSGLIERVGVCRLIRPIAETEAIRKEFDKADRRARLRLVT